MQTNTHPSFGTVRAKGTSGFTLIELTSFVAVICVIIGVLLPAVQSARDARGNQLDGILVGLLMPVAEGPMPPVPMKQIHALVIAPEATGQLANGGGFGILSLTFTDAPGDAFNEGVLKLAAPK